MFIGGSLLPLKISIDRLLFNYVMLMSVIQPASSDMIGYKLFSFCTHANK